jgi:hypothetical protein
MAFVGRAGRHNVDTNSPSPLCCIQPARSASGTHSPTAAKWRTGRAFCQASRSRRRGREDTNFDPIGSSWSPIVGQLPVVAGHRYNIEVGLGGSDPLQEMDRTC